jgi:hypothetical protein
LNSPDQSELYAAKEGAAHKYNQELLDKREEEVLELSKFDQLEASSKAKSRSSL